MKTLSLFTLILLGGLLAQAQAGDCCCNACGCQQVKKVCRLVQGTTKVTTYRYDAKCEDFCMPGHSDLCGTRCVPKMDPCCDKCIGMKKEKIWQPHCDCHIRHKKTLVKIPITKEVPTFTCVVECVCCQCGVAKLDPAATQMAREQGIMPASAEEPIVLEEPATDGGEQAVAAAPAAGAKKKHSASFIGALFGK